MPVIPVETKSAGFPDVRIKTWARVVRGDQTTLLVLADVTAVVLKVFQRPSSTPLTPVHENSVISPASVMETTAQTDEDWPFEDGYSFKDEFDPNGLVPPITASSGSQLILYYTLSTIDGPMVVKHVRDVKG